MSEGHYTHMETTFGGRIGFSKCSCGWRGPNRGYDDGLDYVEATEDDSKRHKASPDSEDV